MDYRMIINEVRAALEEKAAREMYEGAATGGVEAELASMIMSLFVGLRAAYAQMNEINDVWLANGMSERIVAAAQAGEPLAGYSVEAWATWGAILPVAMGFLTGSYVAQLPDGSTRTETPKQVLLRRYTQETQE